MSYSYVSEAKKRLGKEISIRGWIHRKRESGGVIFIIARDRTGTIQVAIKKDKLNERAWNQANTAAIESSIDLKGMVKEDARAPTGLEIEATKFKLISQSEPYPITEYQSAELLLDKRHLWLRSTKMIEIMKARACVFKYTRTFLDKKGFYEITPPVITKAGGETGSEMFELDYFGQKAYLTESSQLYAEAMIYALEKVYSFVPAFRAEKSRTVKHIAELWMLEPEMAYYNMKKNMKLQERLVSYIAASLARQHPEILDALNVPKEPLLKATPPFKLITYEKAIEILNDKGMHLKWGDDFGVEEEKLLTQTEEKPIFVAYWPREIKPFYMPINPKDDRTVMNADLMAPNGHGEILGGSERIWRLEEVMERFAEVEKEKGIKFNLENYSWYLDSLKYGSVPHSGFGMGMERTIKWLLNLDHIRDAIPFPRMVNRVTP